MSMSQGLFETLIKEEQQPFSGWDFSYLEDSGRMVEFPLKWKFSNVLKPYLENCHRLLDMGTGGGEYLSSFAPLPAVTFATEGYEPNVPIATERLAPLGVTVVPIESDDHLPFEEDSFDVIMNKHESFNADEVARLLSEDGYFITQQVGGLNDCELNIWLNAEPSHFSNWSLRCAVNRLKEAGLTILKATDDVSFTRFYDVGAIVYYLKAISWQIPDFSVEKYFDRLEAIQAVIDKQEYIDFTRHRFLIVAQKTKQDELN